MDLKVRKSQFRTKKVKVDFLQNPASCSWNESFEFSIKDLLVDKLYLKLLADGEKVVAKGEVTFTEFEERHLNDRWVSLDDTYKIHIQYSILSMNRK